MANGEQETSVSGREVGLQVAHEPPPLNDVEDHHLSKTLSELSYEHLSSLAISFLDDLRKEDFEDSKDWYSVAGPIVRRRPIRAFRMLLSGMPAFNEALCELFLLGRFRLFMLAYLSVQESDDFEGGTKNSASDPVPSFVRSALFQLGKALRARVAVRVLGSQ